MTRASRPMTVAEKYYAFLDLAWPSNPILSAELTRCFPPEQVEERWRAFCERRIYTRLMPTADLTLVDAGTSRNGFVAREIPRADWAAAVAADADTAYGLERVVALHYLSSPDEERSLMYFVGHHSVADGRGGLMELQEFLRFLDGQDVAVQDEISRPGERAAHPWETDRHAMLDLVRDLSARNRDLGEPLPADWAPASPERRARLSPITLSAEASAVVLERAHQEGVRVFSLMASAWLIEVAGTICSVDDGVFQLNVPADRAVPSDDGRRPTAMGIAVLSHRYRVDREARWPLAREIAATVQGALRRGEGELFFQLARLDGVQGLDRGRALVEAAITGATPATSVTNMGVLDATLDPPWVHAMWGNLAATPNQVISFSTVGYRGQLCCTLWTDDVRVTPAQALALETGFRDALA